MLLADILTDQKIFPDSEGPSTVIYIVQRFIQERSKNAKFESIWFFNFLKDVFRWLSLEIPLSYQRNCFSELEKFCHNIDEMEFVRITKIVSDVLTLWHLERNDGLRLELYRTVATLFEQFCKMNYFYYIL